MQKRYAWLTCPIVNCAPQYQTLSNIRPVSGREWGPAQMLKRLSPHNRILVKEVLRRVDRGAADLNVLLVVVAIGLAALDMTFLVTQKVVDNLPPITHLSYDQAPPTAK
jgi:hypothetical protein